MKTFNATCICGSRIELRDDAESLINGDPNKTDSRGRKFLIEVRAEEWLDRHQPCVDARIKNMTEPKKRVVKDREGQA